MTTLYSGMLWLRRPSDKPETVLTEAVPYAEQKYGRPVRLVARPESESYPDAWREPESGRVIPVRADKRVLAHHLYLVTAVTQTATEENERGA
jgi:hypothetical protein